MTELSTIFTADNYELRQSETCGRYLVARRKISTGQTIFVDEPLATGPKAAQHGNRFTCVGCGLEVDEITRCSQCKLPLCDEDICGGLSTHRLIECRALSQSQEVYQHISLDSSENVGDVYRAILPLRCLYLKHSDPSKWEILKQLAEHVDRRRQDSVSWTADRVFVWNVIKYLQNDFAVSDEEDIHWICSVLDTNAFAVYYGTDAPGGLVNLATLRGVYGLASMLNHDCSPNVRYSFLGPEGKHSMVVKAVRDIVPGEAITTNYTQVLWGTPARRKHLQLAKNFHCACDRCKDPTEFGTYLSAIKCTKCQKPMVPANPMDINSAWECTRKEHRLSSEQAVFIQKSLGSHVQTVNTTNPNQIELFLDRCGDRLVPKSNHIIIELKFALAQLYGNAPGFRLSELPDEFLERKRALSVYLLDVLEKLKTGQCRDRGLLLYELHASLFEIYRRLKEKNLGDSAAKTIQILHRDAKAALTECMTILKGDSTAPSDLEWKAAQINEP